MTLTQHLTWKERLADKIDPTLAREIEVYESQIALKRKGKLDDKVFAETRLRRGVYGQRYDSGQRNDGKGVQQLEYPSEELTKGPETLWDAPGMQRIKIPFGGLNPKQMDLLADLAEEYSDEVCHVTTRQDVQLHYIHIDDTPSLMRRLAATGITTREACGNSVRNVTACPLAGVCRDEPFDVTPYAQACSRFLLGHPDCQDFGRKFKMAFSGCKQHACGLVNMHDFGAIAVKKFKNGVERRGFELHVGGGLGAVPHEAKLFDAFLAEEELLPTAQAIARVFARLGEKRNRARARIKFLVNRLGIDEFRRVVLEERAKLPHDEQWTTYLSGLAKYSEKPLRLDSPLNGKERPNGFDEWCTTNVYRQRQSGYSVVDVTLPLGDLTSRQMRKLADIARRYVGDSVRTTVEQNIALRWVRDSDLPDVYNELKTIGLSQSGAKTIVDITACPGTDTCKLGIASSRGLAAELRMRLMAKSVDLDEAVRALHIKISGCMNSCGHHHIADIGFYGVSRNIGGYTVPHFQLVLGGKWTENAGSYGLAIGAIPSKNIPDAVSRLTHRFVSDRRQGETFQNFIQRLGRKALKELVDDLTRVPTYEDDRSHYSDWGDPREFTIGDMGIGECAGEVVSLADFDIAAAEGQVFEAQLHLEDGNYQKADEMSFGAMLLAARGLIKTEYVDISDDPNQIVELFKERFYNTQLFFDKYAGGKFAQYLFRRHAAEHPSKTQETSRRLIEEAQLFLEATHACHTRLLAQRMDKTATRQ